MLDYDKLKQLAQEGLDEPIEATLNDLKESDLSKLPENITLSVLESEFPEALIWREGESIVTEITEHIYSKFWLHKYHARVFADAMERAVKRLEHEGHPLSDARLESDDDIHIFVRWKLALPSQTSGTELRRERKIWPVKIS